LAKDILLDLGGGDGGLTLFFAQYSPHIVITAITEVKLRSLESKLNNSKATKVEAYLNDSNPIPL
jgi:16S rRNA G1207 methylase RsmC